MSPPGGQVGPAFWSGPQRWWAVAAAAAPVAWAAAAQGLTLPVTSPWRDAAWLAALALAEEALFRGTLQASLLRQTWGAQRLLGVSGANLCSTALFAAAHLWAHSPLQALATVPVSLLLGLAYEQQRRLALPVALHLWFNGCLYIASLHAASAAAATGAH